MASKYELRSAANGKVMFNLKAGNGEIILTSQLYASRDGALNGIESCRINSTVAERYQRNKATNGQPYFNLMAANGQVIGKSETYSSDSAMENGIASVTKNGPIAELSDKTESEAKEA